MKPSSTLNSVDVIVLVIIAMIFFLFVPKNKNTSNLETKEEKEVSKNELLEIKEEQKETPYKINLDLQNKLTLAKRELTVAECRQILGKAGDLYTDDEVTKLKTILYQVARLTYIQLNTKREIKYA